MLLIFYLSEEQEHSREGLLFCDTANASDVRSSPLSVTIWAKDSSGRDIHGLDLDSQGTLAKPRDKPPFHPITGSHETPSPWEQQAKENLTGE